MAIYNKWYRPSLSLIVDRLFFKVWWWFYELCLFSWGNHDTRKSGICEKFRNWCLWKFELLSVFLIRLNWKHVSLYENPLMYHLECNYEVCWLIWIISFAIFLVLSVKFNVNYHLGMNDFFRAGPMQQKGDSLLWERFKIADFCLMSQQIFTFAFIRAPLFFRFLFMVSQWWLFSSLHL